MERVDISERGIRLINILFAFLFSFIFSWMVVEELDVSKLKVSLKLLHKFSCISSLEMSIEEKLKCARTIGEILFTLNMLEYLPLFEKANILEASALRLLREADLKVGSVI